MKNKKIEDIEELILIMEEKINYLQEKIDFIEEEYETINYWTGRYVAHLCDIINNNQIKNEK